MRLILLLVVLVGVGSVVCGRAGEVEGWAEFRGGGVVERSVLRALVDSGEGVAVDVARARRHLERADAEVAGVGRRVALGMMPRLEELTAKERHWMLEVAPMWNARTQEVIDEWNGGAEGRRSLAKADRDKAREAFEARLSVVRESLKRRWEESFTPEERVAFEGKFRALDSARREGGVR